MTDSNLTFYTIPCAEGGPWSPNTEKTRLSLNFKGLKYKTVLLEYPDIKPVLSSLSTPPNTSGFDYSCPALRVGNEVPFMESLDHVHYLDKTFPDLPTLFPTGSEATLERLEEALSTFMGPLFHLLVHDVQSSLLGPGSAPYFKETREKWFGDLSQVAGKDGSEKREDWYEKLDAALKPVVDLLKEKDGPFFEGKTPTFLDLKFTAFLYWAERVKKDVFERLINFDESLPIIYEATAKWRDMGYNGEVTKEGEHAKA